MKIRGLVRKLMGQVWNKEGLIHSGQCDHESEKKGNRKQLEGRKKLTWFHDKLDNKDWSREMMSQRWLDSFSPSGLRRWHHKE